MKPWMIITISLVIFVLILGGLFFVFNQEEIDIDCSLINSDTLEGENYYNHCIETLNNCKGPNNAECIEDLNIIYFVLAQDTGDPNYCDKIDSDEENNYILCVYGVAKDKQDESICEKLHSEQAINACKNEIYV